MSGGQGNDDHDAEKELPNLYATDEEAASLERAVREAIGGEDSDSSGSSSSSPGVAIVPWASWNDYEEQMKERGEPTHRMMNPLLKGSEGSSPAEARGDEKPAKRPEAAPTPLPPGASDLLWGFSDPARSQPAEDRAAPAAQDAQSSFDDDMIGLPPGVPQSPPTIPVWPPQDTPQPSSGEDKSSEDRQTAPEPTPAAAPLYVPPPPTAVCTENPKRSEVDVHPTPKPATDIPRCNPLSGKRDSSPIRTTWQAPAVPPPAREIPRGYEGRTVVRSIDDETTQVYDASGGKGTEAATEAPPQGAQRPSRMDDVYLDPDHLKTLSGLGGSAVAAASVAALPEEEPETPEELEQRLEEAVGDKDATKIKRKIPAVEEPQPTTEPHSDPQGMPAETSGVRLKAAEDEKQGPDDAADAGMYSAQDAPLHARVEEGRSDEDRKKVASAEELSSGVVMYTGAQGGSSASEQASSATEPAATKVAGGIDKKVAGASDAPATPLPAKAVVAQTIADEPTEAGTEGTDAAEPKEMKIDYNTGSGAPASDYQASVQRTSGSPAPNSGSYQAPPSRTSASSERLHDSYDEQRDRNPETVPSNFRRNVAIAAVALGLGLFGIGVGAGIAMHNRNQPGQPDEQQSAVVERSRPGYSSIEKRVAMNPRRAETGRDRVAAQVGEPLRTDGGALSAGTPAADTHAPNSYVGSILGATPQPQLPEQPENSESTPDGTEGTTTPSWYAGLAGLNRPDRSRTAAFHRVVDLTRGRLPVPYNEANRSVPPYDPPTNQEVLDAFWELGNGVASAEDAVGADAWENAQLVANAYGISLPQLTGEPHGNKRSDRFDPDLIDWTKVEISAVPECADGWVASNESSPPQARAAAASPQQGSQQVSAAVDQSHDEGMDILDSIDATIQADITPPPAINTDGNQRLTLMQKIVAERLYIALRHEKTINEDEMALLGREYDMPGLTKAIATGAYLDLAAEREDGAVVSPTSRIRAAIRAIHARDRQASASNTPAKMTREQGDIWFLYTSFNDVFEGPSKAENLADPAQQRRWATATKALGLEGLEWTDARILGNRMARGDYTPLTRRADTLSAVVQESSPEHLYTDEQLERFAQANGVGEGIGPVQKTILSFDEFVDNFAREFDCEGFVNHELVTSQFMPAIYAASGWNDVSNDTVESVLEDVQRMGGFSSKSSYRASGNAGTELEQALESTGLGRAEKVEQDTDDDYQIEIAHQAIMESIERAAENWKINAEYQIEIAHQAIMEGIEARQAQAENNIETAFQDYMAHRPTATPAQYEQPRIVIEAAGDMDEYEELDEADIIVDGDEPVYAMQFVGAPANQSRIVIEAADDMYDSPDEDDITVDGPIEYDLPMLGRRDNQLGYGA